MDKKQIEVGEYVRTKKGYIRKIDKIDYCPICKDKEYINEEIIGNLHFENTYHKNDILNHSKNIIDLIEVGDIVKYKIKVSTTLETKGYIEGITDITDEEHLQSIKDDENYQILEVLTKEQYSSNCFKVKE